MMYELREFGFSTAIGIGGDPVIGTTHIDALEAFEADPETDAIVMIGEIGGDAEERAADYIKANVTKPVVGYVAGFTAPEGKTMGHAGAIVSGSSGTAQAKQEALEAAGVKVGKTPSATAALMREIMQSRTASEPLGSAPEARPRRVPGLRRAREGLRARDRTPGGRCVLRSCAWTWPLRRTSAEHRSPVVAVRVGRSQRDVALGAASRHRAGRDGCDSRPR